MPRTATVIAVLAASLVGGAAEARGQNAPSPVERGLAWKNDRPSVVFGEDIYVSLRTRLVLDWRGFDPELDTTERRKAVTAHLRDVIALHGKRKARQDLPLHPIARRTNERQRTGRLPVDVVLATSMLQVGVDVSRFGLMMVVGQPKNTAEYIQASSRVGRDPARPGLVLTLYNWSRPRDLAHYEDFEHYHATFYRQVEALSVTPFTRRALDRGATGTFVAAVRNTVEHHSREGDAHDVDLDGPEARRITERMLARAERVGGPRGRDYLEERLNRLRDTWQRERTACCSTT